MSFPGGICLLALTIVILIQLNYPQLAFARVSIVILRSVLFFSYFSPSYVLSCFAPCYNAQTFSSSLRRRHGIMPCTGLILFLWVLTSLRPFVKLSVVARCLYYRVKILAGVYTDIHKNYKNYLQQFIVQNIAFSNVYLRCNFIFSVINSWLVRLLWLSMFAVDSRLADIFLLRTGSEILAKNLLIK